MKKWILLLTCACTIVQLYGQRYTRNYHTVRFKFEIEEDAKNIGGITIFGSEFGNYNQDIKVRIAYSPMEIPYNFNLSYFGKQAGELSPSAYWDMKDGDDENYYKDRDPKNNPKTHTSEAWEAWLCTRIIPEEVKRKLDLSCKKGDEDREASYIFVNREFEIMVCFDRGGRIVQVDFAFRNLDLYESVTEEQLKVICSGIVKYCRMIEGIYRLPHEGVEAKEFAPAATYVLVLCPNSDLRWAKECQEYNPKSWAKVLKHFDTLEKRRK